MSPSVDSARGREALLSTYRDDENYYEKVFSRPRPSAIFTPFNVFAVGLLLISLAINAAQLSLWLRSASAVPYIEPPSKYAQLSRTHEEPYVYVTEYALATNDTVQDQAWMSINDDLTLVALSDDYARGHDLRTAQRFPWDQTKGLYLLHGIHNIHCLKNIYISLSEHRRGVKQSRSWHHISHCLDELRRQIVCDADDTPRATDRRAEVVAGLGQHRMCRSWGALEAFAKRHTACYKRPGTTEWEGSKKLELFKHCPPGSGYVVTDEYVPTDEIMEGLPAESIGYVEE
ncbi:hypothetical protein GGS24DRAFT_502371 [Hypoxylon argillaceum]|nr:hypothetical protein GGS24DRAFT_502371 [Hypoxylon argillaceum]KAI1150772.1 hypothetical protein F4825DRAFT_425139 [Nemania diffusa]